MTYKKENFRPKFDPEDVKKYTNNKSDFYNEAIIEKMEVMELVYPEILNQKKTLYNHKKEVYDSKTETIKYLRKILKRLENETAAEKKELDKLNNEIKNYSEVVKENEEIKDNMNQLIKDHESEIITECDFVIRLIYNNRFDNKVRKKVENRLRDEIKAFNSFTDFKKYYLIDYIKKQSVPNKKRYPVKNMSSGTTDYLSAEDFDEIILKLDSF